MRPQDLARLVALAAVWGASYLFMRHAVPQLGPVRLKCALLGLKTLKAGVYGIEQWPGEDDEETR